MDVKNKQNLPTKFYTSRNKISDIIRPEMKAKWLKKVFYF